MRKMMRALAILLTFVLMAGTCDVYASHATTITINTVSSASQADVIDVVLNLANNAGVGGMELIVTYDPEQLTYVEASLTNGFKSGEAFSDIVKIANGKLKLTIAYNDESTYNGGFAVCKFKVTAKPNSNVKIGLSVDTLVDINYNHVENVATGTQFTIVGSTAVRGDANSDGNVNIIDAVLIKQHLAGMTTDINSVASDLNFDGKIDVADAVILMQYLAGYDVLNK